MNYEEYLAHFNPNHDPKNGQFTKSNSSISVKIPEKLAIASSDSSTTKKVKSDYNSLTDSEFLRKYFVKKRSVCKKSQEIRRPLYSQPEKSSAPQAIRTKNHRQSSRTGKRRSGGDEVVEAN